MEAQSWRTWAKWERPVRWVVMKDEGVVLEDWRTSLSRKTRREEAVPV